MPLYCQSCHPFRSPRALRIHPFLQQGDIIVGYNGEQIKSYNDLSAAFKADNTGTVTYLRQVDGDFEQLTAMSQIKNRAPGDCTEGSG